MVYSSVLQGIPFTAPRVTPGGERLRWKVQKASSIEVCRPVKERQPVYCQVTKGHGVADGKSGGEKERTSRRTALLMSLTAIATAANHAASAGAVEVPDLPELDLLKQLAKITEERQKLYEEQDAKFQSSPILKELLKRSEENKKKNKQAIEDKYCIRGAELGIGDCALTGFTQEEREAFIEAIKKRSNQ